MPNETRTIRLEVCMPVTVEIVVSRTEEGDIQIHSGQVVGESYDGDRWINENVDDDTFGEIEKATDRAFRTNPSEIAKS